MRDAGLRVERGPTGGCRAAAGTRPTGGSARDRGRSPASSRARPPRCTGPTRAGCGATRRGPGCPGRRRRPRRGRRRSGSSASRRPAVAGSSSALPGRAVEGERRRPSSSASRSGSGAREDAARHPPARVGIDTDRHESSFPAWSPSLDPPGPCRQDPSVPAVAGAGTGRRRFRFPEAPAAQGRRRQETAVGLAAGTTSFSRSARTTFGSDPALVGQDRDGDPLARAASARPRAQPRNRPEWPSVGWPSTVIAWTPRPYGIAGLRRAVRAMSATIARA